MPHTLRRDGHDALRTWVVFAVLAAGVLYGAGRLSFLCDDAYICFRYVANAHAGHGLVWNPPPFAPVEGYTSFSWAMLLWAAWSWFGVEPPDAANPIAMACGLAQLAVVGLALQRVRGLDGARLRGGVVLTALLVMALDRTYLQWLTSGLETALFNLAFVTWAVLAFRGAARWTPTGVATWAAAAAVAALTRPDGLLLVAATAGSIALMAWNRRTPRLLLGAIPLLGVVAHVVWRRGFYGEWLPNTYYAKVVSAWPEAGLRYLAGFAFEHGAWFWAAIAAAWLAVEARRYGTRLLRMAWPHLPAIVAVAVTVAHVGYYVLIVGGDHFEYRVFSHLIPLGSLAAAAMLARLSSRMALQLTVLAMLGLTGAVGWIQLALTQDQLREVPFHQPVATRLPEWLQPIGRWYDRNQAWLQYHYVCCRCPQHAYTLEKIRALLPPERTWIDVDDADLPLIQTPAAGVPGWVLPNCNVLDLFGLNDWVTARVPVTGSPLPSPGREQVAALVERADGDGDGVLAGPELLAFAGVIAGHEVEPGDDSVGLLLRLLAEDRPDALTRSEAEGLHDLLANLRFMAHERRSPPEYVAALDPNVVVLEQKPVVRRRAVPLTRTRLEEIEREWRQRVAR